MPMSRRCTAKSVTSRPPTTMRPWSGVSKPAMSRSVVVLPHPDGPNSAKNSPARMSSDTASTALTVPAKHLQTASRRIEAGAEGPDATAVGLDELGCTTPRLAPQEALHARVDLVLLRVVPLPGDLLELGDFRFRVEELGVVPGVELHLLVRWRVPHALRQLLLHVRSEHVVDIGEGQLLDLAARRDVQHLLEGQHAFLGRGELDRLVLAVVAEDAAVVDDAHGHLARQQRLLHLAGEVEELDRLQGFERLVGGVEVLETLAVDLAQHHQMRLAEAVYGDQV